VRRRPQRESEPDQPPVAIELGRAALQEVEHLVGRHIRALSDARDLYRLAGGELRNRGRSDPPAFDRPGHSVLPLRDAFR
jgi:hypothetical protein